jgi:hypothetical protein
MGPQRVLSGARLPHAYRRGARRCLRKGARACDRLPAVRADVGRMRAGVILRRPYHRPPHAGHRGGAGRTGKPRFDRCHLSARRTQRSRRRVGGRVCVDNRGWPGVGRFPNRHFRLAVSVLDQPAGRGPRCGHTGSLRAAGPARAACVRRDRRCDPRVRAR